MLNGASRVAEWNRAGWWAVKNGKRWGGNDGTRRGKEDPLRSGALGVERSDGERRESECIDIPFPGSLMTSSSMRWCRLSMVTSRCLLVRCRAGVRVGG